jgi:hypothetical protein
MADPAKVLDQNLLPVQAYFAVDGTFQTFIGQGQPFYASINPNQSGLAITLSTLDSSPIGSITPSTGVFTNVSTTTGSISTTPSANTDIANKFYVDTVAQGLGPKAACAVATTVNITLSGLQTIDTYTTVAGDRVLVKNQSTSSQNGIYIASASAWIRSTDMDVWSEVPGAYTVILNGSQANTGWVCTATASGTIGVTAMPWVQFSGTGSYFAGTGLTLASNTFSITNTGVTAASVGSASKTLTATVNAQGQLTALADTNIAIAATQITSGTIDTARISGSYTGITGVGTLTAGIWNASTIGVAYGGTGAITLTGYVKGSGTSAFTAVSTIPNTDISGLGTMSTQNASSVAITGGSAAVSTLKTLGLTGYLYGNDTSAVTASTTIPTSALSGNFVSTFSAGSTGLTPNSATSGAVTLAGTLAVANGGTGVTASSGANSVVLRDANANITVNCLFEGYATVAASGTTIVLTAASAQNYQITGSGGQVIRLPNATTLPNGALFTFNNNQSSGVITVQNNSSTTIATINSGGYVIVTLLDNAIAAGSWDRHDQTPSNVSWSTNTFDYPGSITSATWNGSTIAINRGGTNGTATPTAGAVPYGTGTAYAFSAAGTSGQVLQSNGSSAPSWVTPTAYATVTDDTTTTSARYPLFASATAGNLTTEYVSSTKLQYVPNTGVLTATEFSGSGASLTSLTAGNLSGTIPSAVLGNSTVYIGTTAVLLNRATGAISLTGTSIDGSAGSATTATTATNATNTAITDDTSTSSAVYPTWVTTTTGNLPQKTSSTKLSFVPSTSTLTATNFAGLASSATNIAGGANLQIPYNTGAGATSFIAAPTLATTYLQYNGTGFVWASVTATTATNLAGGALGSIPYQSALNTTLFLAGNTTTTPQFVTSTGAAGLATAPTLTGSTGSGNVVLATSPTLVTPALGTPSAIVLTNASGTASININGTVGATTANTGAFTTLSASSTVSGTGFSTYLASPPAIGGTTAAAGSFTTLSASSTVSGAGFSTYLASPPAIGGTTAADGSFATLKFNSGYGSVATAYGVRAWVNFNGSTAAIQSSGNVTSITRSSAGNYQVNFTTAMPDANYALAGSGNDNAALITTFGGTYSTTTARVLSVTSTNGSASDWTRIGVVILR